MKQRNVTRLGVTSLAVLASTLVIACGPASTGDRASGGPTDGVSIQPSTPGGTSVSGGVTAGTDGGRAPNDAGPGASNDAGAGASSGGSTPAPGNGSSEAGAPGVDGAPGTDGTDAGAAAPVVSQAGKMPLISGGLPTYSNYAASPAASAVDADYSTVWRTEHDPAPTDPNWLAIDLSTVPVAARSTVYSLWFNEYGYNYDTSDGPSYTLPGDYTIDASSAPGGGQPPTTGWTTLVTMTGNLLSSGANMLDLSGYDWLRIHCTASASNVAAQNTDTSLQWNLYDAHAGNDGWKFGGDSITANAMGHQATNDSFDQLVHAVVPNDPAFEMAGHGGWSTATELANIDAFLANFPGRYYGLSLGTNDAPGNDPAGYLANMTQLVETVLAAGKVPVIPTIPYTGEPTHATIPEYNAQIQALYATYGAKLMKGPDLYSVIYAGRATMFTNPTDLHPNAVGNAAIRQAWATAMIANVYGQ